MHPQGSLFKLEGATNWAGAGEGLIIQWRSRLRWLVYETLGALRTTQLFDIIIDYPDSTPAVEDLRLCLENTNHHAQVGYCGSTTWRTLRHNSLLSARRLRVVCDVAGGEYLPYCSAEATAP